VEPGNNKTWHSRPQSRLALLATGDWARGSSRRLLRGPSGSGDENARCGYKINMAAKEVEIDVVVKVEIGI